MGAGLSYLPSAIVDNCKFIGVVEDEIPLKLNPINDIPQARDILDAARLTEILAETREFIGDEFAKLLHKCHNIIRNNDKLSPEAVFDEISKILFIKIM